MHNFWIGLLFGLAAAMTIGPIMIEMTRRTLLIGGMDAFALCMGACLVDTTYAGLALAGGLVLVNNHPIILTIITFLGSVFLGYLGINTLKNTHKLIAKFDALSGSRPATRTSFFRTIGIGYLMTALSPLTILFWIALASQLTVFNDNGAMGMLWLTLGIFIGAISFGSAFIATLHRIRHKISKRALFYINTVGGLCLVGFGLTSLVKLLNSLMVFSAFISG